ncbi:uncharacterized protein [Palaemon carinicauda]|uniref:uncharacterized protein n=1 Tax=Palaemon carinicauda TaxID=392227 RepID=UPI0035B5736A
MKRSLMSSRPADINHEPAMKFSFAIGIILVLVASNEAQEDLDLNLEGIKELVDMTPTVVDDGDCIKYSISGDDCELVMRVEKLESLPLNTLIPLYTQQNWRKFVDVVIAHNLGGQCFCPSLKVTGCKPIVTTVIDNFKESFCNV